MMGNRKKQTGFTIVELLIVIVIIGILAAIAVVAYNGIQNRAYDTAVRNDLTNIAKKLRLHETEFGMFPTSGNGKLTTALGLKVSSTAYGNHLISGGNNYNLLYCWPNSATPSSFALIASSKSGKVFEYTVTNGLREVAYAFSGGSIAVCTNAGNTMDVGSDRDFFYNANIWLPFANA